jgi:dolichol-phosphate mannosyltransferase
MTPQTQGLVILPTYNERSNIEPLLKRILEVSPDVDILVVDDASPDGTGQIAQAAASQNSRIHVLHRTGPRGRGLAGIDGFRWALAKGYDPILEMDADFSHDPADIPRFLEKIKEADVVIGSRFVEGGSDDRGWCRKTLSRIANFFSSLVLALAVKDQTSGFRCFRGSALKPVFFGNHILSEGPSIIGELLYKIRSKAMIVEIPIRFNNQTYLTRVRKKSRDILPLFVLKKQVKIPARLGFYQTWEEMESVAFSIIDKAVIRAAKEAWG